jgi:hypothetical protein
MRDFAGLAALDDLFQVGGEVRVESRLVAQLLGVILRQSDGFGEQAGTEVLADRTEHGDRHFAALGHHFAPARTRASTSVKLLAASASEMWITGSAIAPVIALRRIQLRARPAAGISPRCRPGR